MRAQKLFVAKSSSCIIFLAQSLENQGFRGNVVAATKIVTNYELRITNYEFWLRRLNFYAEGSAAPFALCCAVFCVRDSRGAVGA